MKVYIVIKLTKDAIQIMGVFRKESDAEIEAYGTPWKSGEWVNIIEKEVK